jgi:fructose-bisphosphate aldolase, class I
LVLRTDCTNVYGEVEIKEDLFCELIKKPLEQAIKLDAACVVANIFKIPKEDKLYQQCIKNIMKLKPKCEKYGMPLMVEPLVLKINNGRYEINDDIEEILPLVRQAVELGVK